MDMLTLYDDPLADLPKMMNYHSGLSGMSKNSIEEAAMVVAANRVSQLV